MRNALIIAAALMFLGAGCAAQQGAELNVQTSVPGAINASVDGIIDGGAAEQSEHKADVNDSANSYSGDSAQINSYDSSTYDIK